ncbi:LytR/AlgR family response regulator transcription factor [Dyadobacter sediminis]|uniref:Response regulator transcription factor n=1 Tax=Dyadobacter sediminis TaxID=1493691 RepID=A0A5R9KFA1_9BACT|nr:LytTR family DNA-binding domain-containing protein [Dyadobacter sediminis]TLU94784.1 response regulator transcription factor [Dyadobacter sediminis]GGB88179.1 DNA-binding response regulator [Dyadobacter sediminis]
MTNVLIIESKLQDANALKRMIEQANPDYNICGVVNSVKDARNWIMNNKSPQLIFCDIQLPDGSGFDLFGSLPVAAPVIFCSNTQEHAFKAFENNAIDYLVKPFSSDRLQKSFRKFTQFRQLFGQQTVSQAQDFNHAVSNVSKYKSSLLVYYQDKIIPISLDKLDFIYYNNYQVNVHTQNAQYETRDTLNSIINSLNPHDFFRANRQFIIHRKSVTSIQQYFGRKLLVGTSFPTPEPVIISKANASEFLKWVEGLNKVPEYSVMH